MIPGEREIEAVMDELGYDRMPAIRFIQSRHILRKRAGGDRRQGGSR